MMEPVRRCVWFAGEAAHETLWGTVGGAWESGERAADAVLRRMGVLKTPAPEAEAAPKPKPKPKAKGTRVARREQSSFGGTPNIMRPERKIMARSEKTLCGEKKEDIATARIVARARASIAAGAPLIDKRILDRLLEKKKPKQVARNAGAAKR